MLRSGLKYQRVLTSARLERVDALVGVASSRRLLVALVAVRNETVHRV